MYKMGRTTGMTSGYIQGTCWNTTSGGFTYLCQNVASYYSQGGDSGAPVFTLDANLDATIHGIHRASQGTAPYWRIFSTLGGIYSDLDVYASWDTCAPGFGC